MTFQGIPNLPTYQPLSLQQQQQQQQQQHAVQHHHSSTIIPSSAPHIVGGTVFELPPRYAPPFKLLGTGAYGIVM
jgi:hypothetical protein